MWAGKYNWKQVIENCLLENTNAIKRPVPLKDKKLFPVSELEELKRQAKYKCLQHFLNVFILKSKARQGGFEIPHTKIPQQSKI